MVLKTTPALSMAENRWVTGVVSRQSMEFMDPTGRKLGCPSASSSTNGTSGSYSYLRWEIIFGGPCLEGILPCGHMLYIYIYLFIYLFYILIYLPGKSYCHFVLVKTHFSSFFVDYRFLLNIRYFSNLRVRFFFSTTC